MRVHDLTMEVVNNLSLLINNALSAEQAEKYHPRGSPDESEAEIEHKRRRVVVLRNLRTQLENEMTQPVEPQFKGGICYSI